MAQQRARHADSHRKFLLGLSFEKANIAIVGHEYIPSDKAGAICYHLINTIEKKPQLEHAYYQKGQTAFQNKIFMENKTPVHLVEKIFGQQWKKIRYHHLVRLGGDILRTGLGQYPKATILGALLSYRQID